MPAARAGQRLIVTGIAPSTSTSASTRPHRRRPCPVTTVRLIPIGRQSYLGLCGMFIERMRPRTPSPVQPLIMTINRPDVLAVTGLGLVGGGLGGAFIGSGPAAASSFKVPTDGY